MLSDAGRRTMALRGLRFLLVGGLNALFGYLLFAVLVLAALPIAAALLLATVGGVIFNFFTTSRWVFRNGDLRLLPRFVLAYVAVYAFNLALLDRLGPIGLSPLVAQLACLLPSATVSFAVLQIFVFRRRDEA